MDSGRVSTTFKEDRSLGSQVHSLQRGGRDGMESSSLGCLWAARFLAFHILFQKESGTDEPLNHSICVFGAKTENELACRRI